MSANPKVFLLQTPIELSKRLEEVRLLESRKSARLMDQDTDFARLADMAGDRKKTSSHSIDVPFGQGREHGKSYEKRKERWDRVLFLDECQPNAVVVGVPGATHEGTT
ncbi:hypothetical protein RUM43_000961 [Polyplax serrata]|uniref:Uncharacterized protein n=1 Tax=Polyplax serrata TaxID=468196 RepID=A0AAN8XNW3_POLSC